MLEDNFGRGQHVRRKHKDQCAGYSLCDDVSATFNKGVSTVSRTVIFPTLSCIILPNDDSVETTSRLRFLCLLSHTFDFDLIFAILRCCIINDFPPMCFLDRKERT